MENLGAIWETAQGYISEAQLAPTKRKTYLLSQVGEILLHRAPSLVPQFLPYLCGFQTDQTTVVRRSVLTIVRSVAIKFPRHFAALVDVARYLRHDAEASVSVLAIDCLRAALPSWLGHVGRSVRGGDQSSILDAEKTWLQLSGLFPDLQTDCLSSGPLAPPSLSFAAEMLVHGTPLADGVDPPGAFRASMLPEEAPPGAQKLVSAAALRRYAAEFMGALRSAVHVATGPAALAALEAACAAAGQRRSLLEPLCAPIAELATGLLSAGSGADDGSADSNLPDGAKTAVARLLLSALSPAREEDAPALDALLAFLRGPAGEAAAADALEGARPGAPKGKKGAKRRRLSSAAEALREGGAADIPLLARVLAAAAEGGGGGGGGGGGPPPPPPPPPTPHPHPRPPPPPPPPPPRRRPPPRPPARPSARTARSPGRRRRRWRWSRASRRARSRSTHSSRCATNRSAPWSSPGEWSRGTSSPAARSPRAARPWRRRPARRPSCSGSARTRCTACRAPSAPLT